MAKERANIYTIAKEAGVSPATVSRVMTNSARVSAEKRERVEEVIRKYKYTPNALAPGLSTAKTHTIGLMITDISNPFYATVASACEREANRLGYMLLVLCSLSDYELEKRQLMKLYEQHVDAILIVGGKVDHESADEEYVEMLNQMAAVTPIIATGRPTGAETLQVSLDEGDCMDQAMEYLIGLGHRKISLIGGFKFTKSTFEKRVRYRAALRRHEIPYREDYVFETDYTNESGYECMKRLLEREEDMPTAVIAINDFTASGIIQMASEKGLSVPEDLSVISFDDTYLAEVVTPRLTSVGCDYAEFARMLMETAVRAGDGEEMEPVQIVPVRMTVRNSCRPLAQEESRTEDFEE